MRKNYTPKKDKRFRALYPFISESNEEWDGNKPHWKDINYHGISIINKDTNEPIQLDRWSFKYGYGWTYTNTETCLIEFPCFSVYLEDNVCIALITPLTSNTITLFIDRITYGSVWKYRSDSNEFSHTKPAEKDNYQPLNQDEYERIKYILNTKIDDCYIWDKFQEKCIEIFDGLNKGKFIDYL